MLRRVIIVVAALLIAASCGGDDGQGGVATTTSTEAPEPTSNTTTTTASMTTTEEGATTSSSIVTPLEVEVTRDVQYHEDIAGLHPPLLDVYAPTTNGPWPIVVMFHGGAGLFQNKLDTEPMARLVAAEGAVVFAPSIGGPDPDAESPDPAIMTTMLDEVACATSFSVEHGEDYDADPAELTIFGFSGGAQAVGVTLWGGRVAGDGCFVDAPPPMPSTAVFFEGDWFLAPSWDDALHNGDLLHDEITIWDDLDGAPGVEVVLVVGTETRNSPPHRVPLGDIWSSEDCGRDVDPGSGWVPRGGTCRYLELRDPDGEYRRDMEKLGLLDDDGWHDVSENTTILADRLERAGHPPVIITVEGLSHADSPSQRATQVGPIIVEHALH